MRAVPLSGNLLHYRILESIGQGGMGEVYSAEDTKLHRTVALKVLPEVFAIDPARRQRFEREAQAVAALNHPNIVTIYSVEEADGVPFLTMELVEGKPLNELIPTGGMPVDALLRVGLAIADAIAAAQQRGITHRDLKPANVMVTPEGRVKVLDFGLARVHDVEAAVASEDLTRLGAGNLTGEGKIIGTVAYMSPEQAEGRAVDPRSDIFSLGVLLHEMATGARPFKGDTNVSIISSILKDTPSSVTELNPSLPADLARIVRRCLAKDPSRRFQTAADLRAELEDLATEIAHPSGVTVRPTTRRRARPIVIASLAALVLTLIVVAAWVYTRDRVSRSNAGARLFAIGSLARLTTSGNANFAALSPDGRYVVHVKMEAAGPSLWIRQTATTSDVRIVPPSPAGYDSVTFSPDGNFVYYNAYGQSGGGVAWLYKIPALGGVPSPVLEDIDSAPAFSPDGNRIAFARGAPAAGKGAVIIANTDGSGQRTLTEGEPGILLINETPAWSPDGKTILANGQVFRGTPQSIVYAIDSETGHLARVGEPWGFFRNLQWLPDGRSFLVDGVAKGSTRSQIWQVSYPSGERRPVTNDLNTYRGVSASADGRSVVTVQATVRTNLWLLEPGTSKAWRRVTSGARADGIEGIAFLPDGRLVYASDASGTPQLFICDRDGGNARQLTNIEGQAGAPSATPDGKWIFFQAFTRNGGSIYRIAADGTGLQRMTSGEIDRGPIASPDSKWVYYTDNSSGRPHPARIAVDGGPSVRLADAYFRPLQISPDGTRVFGIAWNQDVRHSQSATMPAGGGALTFLPEAPEGARLSRDWKNYLWPEPAVAPNRLMTRPVSGGPARELLQLQGEEIFNGTIAPDGAIAVSRGTASTDVVVISAAASADRE